MLYLYLTGLIILDTIFLAMVPFVLPGNWLMATATAMFA